MKKLLTLIFACGIFSANAQVDTPSTTGVRNYVNINIVTNGTNNITGAKLNNALNLLLDHDSLSTAFMLESFGKYVRKSDSIVKYVTPTQLNSGLAGKQDSLGYIAESVSNKINSISGTSAISYTSEGAVKNYVDGVGANIRTALVDSCNNIRSAITGGVVSETDPVVKAINGLVKSNGSSISAAVPGTDYLLPTGSAAGLTSFPTFNQNTTGSAASLTTARTINGVSFNGTANITVPAVSAPGLSSGSTNDSLVVADASTGVLKRISSTRIASTPSALPPLPEISKVVDWFDASDITGLSEGASVSTWPNRVAGGASMAAVNAPTYMANYKGMPAVRFTSSSSQSMTFTSHAWKQCIVIGNNLDGSTFASYAGLISNAGTSGFAWYADPGTSTTGMGKTTGTVTTQGFGSSNNSFFPLERTKITELTEPAGVAATTLRLGAFWDPIPGRYWNGAIHKVIFLDQPLSAPAFNIWYNYFVNEYRLDKAPFVRAAGNSIMIGGYPGVTTSQSVGYYIQQYMKDYYNNDVDFVNKAVGGNTNIQQDYLAGVAGGIDFEMDKQVIMGNIDIPFLGFTNDLPGPGTAVGAFNDMLTFCNNRIKKNPSVRIWVIPPYSCDSGKVNEAERQIVLQMMRDFKSTKNIRMMPADDTLLYAPNACYTSGLFSTDFIHLNYPSGTQYAAKVFMDFYTKNNY